MATSCDGFVETSRSEGHQSTVVAWNRQLETAFACGLPGCFLLAAVQRKMLVSMEFLMYPSLSSVCFSCIAFLWVDQEHKCYTPILSGFLLAVLYCSLGVFPPKRKSWGEEWRKEAYCLLAVHLVTTQKGKKTSQTDSSRKSKLRGFLCLKAHSLLSVVRTVGAYIFHLYLLEFPSFQTLCIDLFHLTTFFCLFL